MLQFTAFVFFIAWSSRNKTGSEFHRLTFLAEEDRQSILVVTTAYRLSLCAQPQYDDHHNDHNKAVQSRSVAFNF